MARRCSYTFLIWRCGEKSAGIEVMALPTLASSSAGTPVLRLRDRCAGLMKPSQCEASQSFCCGLAEARGGERAGGEASSRGSEGVAWGLEEQAAPACMPSADPHKTRYVHTYASSRTVEQYSTVVVHVRKQ